ncbi:uncharacterized protein DNG_08129 [Cephalotrichum gorgonifer]|uniref:Uncharacterized protein n=1 Tax=Cephalotrichum gorgonifer TaxID=2041049 RepID=A0AAE8N5W5_9PEZI|nr:uncharacterized protein DNG_08129 [Cephalotrichum gorgonifer]
MKPSATTVSSALLGGAAFASAGTVGNCISLSYADGGIYCRESVRGGCLADLGDFPAKKSFRLNVLWADDMSLHLLEQTGTSRTYIQYQDKLYLDTSPGAFQPLSFTADNNTLASGETSWAWTGAEGFILWSPTGRLRDSTPRGDGSITGQGFELVEVEGYPGLKQAYWNQTLWEEVWAGREQGKFLSICYGDYKPKIIQGDRP